MTRLVSMLLMLLLAGCTASRYELGAVGPDQGVYLDSRPIKIPQEDIDLYGCENDFPLICECTGRMADCLCRCPLPL